MLSAFCLPLNPSPFLCLYVYMSIYLPIFLSLSLSIYLPVFLSLYLCTCLLFYFSICQSTCLSFYLSYFLSNYLTASPLLSSVLFSSLPLTDVGGAHSLPSELLRNPPVVRTTVLHSAGRTREG